MNRLPFPPASPVGLMAIGAILGPSIVAQDLPLGSELQINAHTLSHQRAASVASHADGSFVVAWEDGTGDVEARRFDDGANPLGDDFLVNSYTSSTQSAPAVAAGTDGFVIVWQSLQQYGSGYSVLGQRFDGNGDPAGGEFRIPSHTTGGPRDAAVAMHPDGGFVVVWEDDGPDGDRDGVFARRFAAHGGALGGDLQINDTTLSDQRNPAVVALGAGFVVAWESHGQDGDRAGVFVRRFAADGSPLGDELQANSYTTSNQQHPALTGDGSGGFVVVWDSPFQDGNALGIFGRRFDAAGDVVADEFVINSTTVDSQTSPSVSADRAGGFVVVWESQGEDGDLNGIFGQRFDPNGDSLGPQRRINSYTTGQQRAPSVAVDADGDFVVAWQSNAQDGDLYGIFAQPFHTNHIGDRVWNDGNGDGLQGAAEAGLEGVLVHVYDDLQTYIRSTTTDEEGRYRLNALPPGDYYVQFEPPPSWAFTLLDSGGDDAADSDADPLTGETDTFSLGAGESRLEWDAGIFGILFLDGFESGDTGAWASATGG